MDVLLTCRQSDKILGSYVKGKIGGEEAHHKEDPSLYVIHSGSQVHTDTGREVYRSGDFVDGSSFKTYLNALKKDVEECAVVIPGANVVEYTSPWLVATCRWDALTDGPRAVLSKDDLVSGDWFVNVMFKNPSSFKHRVTAVRTPAGEDNTEVINLRLHAEVRSGKRCSDFS